MQNGKALYSYKTFSLQHPGYTYGAVMCGSLKVRQKHFEAFNDADLNIYARVRLQITKLEQTYFTPVHIITQRKSAFSLYVPICTYIPTSTCNILLL